jgi:hypothetical protein
MITTSSSVQTEPHVLGTHSDGEEGKQMQYLRQRDRGCRFYALKKKEIAAAARGGWEVTEYLQLNWMDGKSFTTTMSFTICNY